MPIKNSPEDLDVAVLALVNNPIHQSYMKNINIKNYHYQNRINTNNIMVALQILIKQLHCMKSKKEYARKMKNKLQKQNPHVNTK